MPYIGTIAGTTNDSRIPDPGTAGQVLKSDGSGTWQTQDPGHLELPVGNVDEVLTFDGANWVSAVSMGGGGGSTEAVASGALTDGSTVILRTDGKVEIVDLPIAFLDVPGSQGTDVRTAAHGSSSADHSISIDFDPNDTDKFVILYRESGQNDLRINVGTISGNTISMGTAFAVSVAPFTQYFSDGPKVKYHPVTPNLVAVMYAKQANGWAVKTFLVTGSSVTGFVAEAELGMQMNMNTGMPHDSQMMYGYFDWDPAYTTSNRWLLSICGATDMMQTEHNPTFLIAGTCDNNGTNISWGSSQNWSQGTSAYGLQTSQGQWSFEKFERPVAFDPNTAGKFAYANWDDTGGNQKLQLYIGTISGTSITLGSPVNIDPGGGGDRSTMSNLLWNSAVADTLLISWVAPNRSNRPQFAIATVSGTTPTVAMQAGSVPFEVDAVGTGNIKFPWWIMEFNADRIYAVGYANQKMYQRCFPWTGTTITAPHAAAEINHTAYPVNSSTNSYYQRSFAAASDGATRIIAMYYTVTGPTYPYHEFSLSTFLGSAGTNMTADNFLGISDGIYADGATATIQLPGAVDDAQSGLTIGSKYYVQPDGTLATTAGTPEVLVGTAVSATKILIADTKVESMSRVTSAAAVAAEAAARAAADTTIATDAATDATTKADQAESDAIAQATTLAYAVDTLQIVASGDLANGNKVILQADGTAKVVSNTPAPLDTPTTDTQSQTMGVRVDEPTVAQGSSQTDQPQQKAFISWDPLDENRFIIAYKDGGGSNPGTGYPKAVVGTISGTTISLGTPVDIDTDNDSSPVAIHFHPDVANLVACAYGANYTGTKSPILKFGMIESGQFIAKSVLNMHLGGSYGSSVPHFEKGSFAFDWDRNSSGTYREYACGMDCWFDYSGTNNYRMPVLRAGKVTQDAVSIQPGSATWPRGLFTAGNYQWGGGQIKSLRFDPNTHKKFLYVHHYPSGGGGIGHALRIVNLDSNNYPNQGSEIQLTAQGVDNSDDGCYCEWNPSIANQIVFSGKTNNPATMCVGTVSGTSVSWGTRFTPTASNTNSSQPWNIFFALGSAAGRFYGVTTIYTGNSTDPRPLVCQAFNITGTTITEVGSPVTIADHNWFDNTLTYPWHAAPSPSGRKFMVSHTETTGDTQLTTGTIGSEGVTNLTTDNFLGISDGVYSSGATATVQLSGATDDAQSGLTTGSTYYVQPDGSLATTSATPSVFAGQALSATSLLIAATRPGVVGSQLPLPGTTGKILTSDGTNWTSGDARALGTLKPLHQGLFL